MDGLEDLGKLIYGLDSEFSGGSSCGIDNFGIFGVSSWFKDYGDVGIPAEGGIEGRDVGIPTEDGIEGCVFFINLVMLVYLRKVKQKAGMLVCLQC